MASSMPQTSQPKIPSPKTPTNTIIVFIHCKVQILYTVTFNFLFKGTVLTISSSQCDDVAEAANQL